MGTESLSFFAFRSVARVHVTLYIYIYTYINVYTSINACGHNDKSISSSITVIGVKVYIYVTKDSQMLTTPLNKK